MNNAVWKHHVVTTACQHIQEICSPLKHLAIDGFFFMRIYPNGQFIDLATDLHWSDHFLERYFKESYNFSAVKKHIALEKNIDIWSLSTYNEFYHDARTHFAVQDGISITQTQKHYKDIFCFYVKKCAHPTVEFLIESVDILRKFSTHFLQKAAPILREGKKHPLLMPHKYREVFASPTLIAKQQHDQLLQHLFNDSRVNFANYYELTPREIDCIIYAGEGLDSDNIAKRMFISKRTAEDYLMSARKKLNCKNTVALVNQYQLLKNIL